jgi:hypothetical protein
MSVDVGEGWRRLEVGERIEAGDEYLDERDGWKRVPHFCTAHAGFLLPYRRRVAAAAADATTPTPMSVADIQTAFCRAMFQATDDWILRGGPPPNDDTIAKIDPR